MNNSKKRFSIVDFPEKGKNTGLYTGKNLKDVSEKIFKKMAKAYNFYDNLGGKKYLVFSLIDLDSKKIYTFIGTIIKLHIPIDINIGSKNVKITHRNIVTKYDNNMREVFENYL